MVEFKHSIVLFTGHDDGLPLEFNVRNTADKAYLKALIEHGGGICTQNENAVHLISPETKVLNVDLGKKLVSTSYIFECVKKNYLLDVNDYVFIISEAKTSDISDEDSERLQAQIQSTCKSPIKNHPGIMNMVGDVSPIKNLVNNETGSTTASNLTLPSSNSALPNNSSTHSESFIEGSQEVTSNLKISYCGNISDKLILSSKASEPLKSPEKAKFIQSNLTYSPTKEQNASALMNMRMSPAKPSHILITTPIQPMNICDETVTTSPFKSVEKAMHTSPVQLSKTFGNEKLFSPTIKIPVPQLTNLSPLLSRNPLSFQLTSPVRTENAIGIEPASIVPPCNDVEMHDLPTSPADIVVSSSQPNEDGLDQFDNMLLSKIQKKQQSEEEESLSQSYTVSSSADAQVASKPSSIEVQLPEMLENNENALPDSPSLVGSQINEEAYLNNLEAEVQDILKKPSPKTIQDKIALVKYICCVRKLPPATVLESLYSDSLDLLSPS